MLFDIRKEELEALKMLYVSAAYGRLSIDSIVKTILHHLLLCYKETKEIGHMHLAFMHIKAYIELGFIYDVHKALFDQVLAVLGFSAEDLFPAQDILQEALINKNSLRKIIKRWSSSKYHTKPIEEVIEEIVNHVEKNEQGNYYYHSNENPNHPESDHIYELVIHPYESYIRDTKKNKCYKLK